MFDVAARDALQAALVRRAEQDERITAAALIGSLTTDRADRWSDLDLTFGVAPQADPAAVVEDWTAALAREYAACPLFDLHTGGAHYRVLMIPGLLQVDLSFAPGGRVLQSSPRLQLLFGEAAPMERVAGAPGPQGDLAALAAA